MKKNYLVPTEPTLGELKEDGVAGIFELGVAVHQRLLEGAEDSKRP